MINMIKKAILVVALAALFIAVDSLLAVIAGPWLALGLTAMLYAVGYGLWRTRGAPLFLAVLVVSFVVTGTASAATGGAWVSPTGYGTHHDAEVWHTSHAPVGGYVSGREFLTVQWNSHLTYDVNGGPHGHITDLGFHAGVQDERSPIDVIGIVASTTDHYRCSMVEGWGKGECVYFYRKWKVRYEYAKIGVFIAYPWVKLRISGEPRNPIKVWDWSTGIF